MALEEAGVRLIIDGVEAFNSGMQESSDSVGQFGESADSASEQSNVLSDTLDALGGLMSGAFQVAVGIGTAAVAGLAAGLALTVPAALENEQTMARLESQLKATGGRAGLTMSDLTDLAGSFQDLAGGTDDTVLAIESVGLKFASITKDVMPQFIQASLDMAAVTGQDAVSAANGLALALEDPAATLGRLRRAGIVFTDQEEEQIKAMAAAGEQAAAQQMILDKLAATTGGAAAAQAATLAGQWEIFKNRMGEAAETIGTALLPGLQMLFDTVIAPAIPVIETIAVAFGDFLGTFSSGDFEDPIGNLANLFYEVANALGADGGGVFAAVIGLRDEFDSLVAFFTTNMPEIQATAKKVFDQIGRVFNAVSDLVLNTLIPAFSELFNAVFGEMPTAQETFDSLAKGIVDGVTVAADFIVNVLVPAVRSITEWLQVNLPPAIQTAADFWNNVLHPAITEIWNFTVTYLIPIIEELIEWVQTNLPVAIQAATDFWNNVLLPAMTDIWTFISVNLIPIIKTTFEWLQTHLPAAIQKTTDFWNNVLLPVITAVYVFVVQTLIPALQALAGVALAAVELGALVVARVFNEVLVPSFSWAATVISVSLSPILAGLARMFNDVVGPAVVSFTVNAINGLSASLDSVVGWIQEVTSWLEELKKKIKGIDLGPLQPGSPTPFEIGLRGAAQAAALLTGEMATLEQAAASALVPFSGMTAGSVTMATAAPRMATAAPAVAMPGMSAAAVGSTTHNEVNINANYARYQEPPELVQDFNLAMALL